MRKRTLFIHCKDCGKHLYSYLKLGKGRLIRCWKNRILINYTIQSRNLVYCSCGNLIGLDKNFFIIIKKYHVEIKNK